MTIKQQLDAWRDQHLHAFIFALRIILAGVLITKGFLFMFGITDLVEVVRALGYQSFNVTLALIIAWAHLLCGFLIVLGLATRVACVVMFPILVGAVFYVNMGQGFITYNEWVLSVVVLFLTVFFFVYGNGEYSVVKAFLGNNKEVGEPAGTKPEMS